MTRDYFEKLLKEMSRDELHLNNTKGRDYSTSQDVLDNFKRLAAETGVSKEIVLWVYLKKHLDALATYVRTGKVSSEGILGRIEDSRLYLALLLVMHTENTAHEEEVPKASKEPMSTQYFEQKWVKLNRPGDTTPLVSLTPPVIPSNKQDNTNQIEGSEISEFQKGAKTLDNIRE